MSRLKPNDRRDQILAAALQVAEKTGYNSVTRDAIANAAQCAPGLVSNYFGTMIDLRRHIMRAAIRQQNLVIIAQGLAAKDPHARKASETLKKSALATLAA